MANETGSLEAVLGQIRAQVDDELANQAEAPVRAAA
jgi:hypothetical protein